MYFEFFLREAWMGFRRGGVMSFLSLATITVSLVIFGSFILVMANLNNIIGNIGSKVEIVAFVDKSIDDYTANTYIQEFKKYDGVDSVKYISKEKGWEDFKENYGGRLQLDEIIRDNPLPNTFVVKVKTLNMVNAVAKKLSNVPTIDEVRYSGRLADRVKMVIDAVKIGGLIIVVLLLFATLFIVVNTIKLTVIARNTDIAIMRLVGATDSFIKWPFIIEGLLIGLIGASLSLIMIKFSYDIIIMEIRDAVPFVPLIIAKPQLYLVYLSVGLVGILLGIIGGYLSVNSLLKEKF